jgi:hypothetical protein
MFETIAGEVSLLADSEPGETRGPSSSPGAPGLVVPVVETMSHIRMSASDNAVRRDAE